MSRRIPPRIANQPVQFRTSRMTVARTPQINDAYSSEGYDSKDDIHPIEHAPNPNNKRTVLLEWTRPIKKREKTTARTKVPPTKAETGK